MRGGLAFVGLDFYGAGLGATEVGLNVEAAEVERIIDGPVLPPMHGSFSLGTFVGGVSGIALNAYTVPAWSTSYSN